jgi:RimJ/RimL family protein N-acetyltransferase
MRHEGTLRQEIKKWDEYLDVEMYAILRGET